jgi:hypothetical protein
MRAAITSLASERAYLAKNKFSWDRKVVQRSGRREQVADDGQKSSRNFEISRLSLNFQHDKIQIVSRFLQNLRCAGMGK